MEGVRGRGVKYVFLSLRQQLGCQAEGKNVVFLRDKKQFVSQLNEGDLLAIYTNGIYPATRHRVVVPENKV
jgi:isopenicillin N synthase-like dioxygenase